MWCHYWVISGLYSGGLVARVSVILSTKLPGHKLPGHKLPAECKNARPHTARLGKKCPATNCPPGHKMSDL